MLTDAEKIWSNKFKCLKYTYATYLQLATPDSH